MKRGAALEDLHTPPANRKRRRFWESWSRRKPNSADRSVPSNIFHMESLEPRILLSGDPLLVSDAEELVAPLVEELPSEVHIQEQAAAATFSLTTRSLDVDQDGEVTVEEDATLILRHLFGLTGQALVDGAVDTVNGLRQDATAITDFLTKSETTMLDPDANGTADVMSDGLTIFRYITLITGGGLTVDDMANGVVDLVGGNRTDPNEIKAYLDGFLPGMDEIAPVITAGLLNDTGADPTDTLTFDPTIGGLIEDKNPIVRFEASIDGGGFHDALSLVQLDGSFQFDQAFLEILNGGALLDGAHTVRLLAEDDHANVADPVQATGALVAKYELDIDLTWGAESHPDTWDLVKDIDPHLSGFGGATHTSDVAFWEEGALASQGMEELAEIGDVRFGFTDEVNAAIAAGTAFSSILLDEVTGPGDFRVIPFVTTQDFPLFTFATMIGPSPDWFVGVSGLPLVENGLWRDTVVVDLFPYDAGTEDGDAFSLDFPATVPPEPISLITEQNPRLIGPASLGTFTFQRVSTLEVAFILDTTPPEVSIFPADGAHPDFCFRDVELNFNERMDESTLTADTIQLFSAGDLLNPILPADIQFSNDGQQVFLRYDLFDPGDYELRLDGSVIADYAGNMLGGMVTSDFVVEGPTAIWANPNGGFWDDPDNWVGGILPGADDTVFISVEGDVTVTHRTGLTNIHCLRTTETLVLSGGTLDVAGIVEIGSILEMAGGTLANATVVPATGGEQVIISANSSMDGVTLEADLVVNNNVTLNTIGGSTNALGAISLAGILNANGGADGQGGDFFAEGDNVEFTGNRARVFVSNGAHVVIVAPFYSSVGLPHGSNLFSVNGLGSELRLPDLVTLDAGFDLAGNLNQHNIVVQNQGHLDLSALETVIAPVGAELLDWQITSGGRVDLLSLESITPGAGATEPGLGQTRFLVNNATVNLPALTTVKQVTFDVQNAAVVTAASLATYTSVGLPHNTNFFLVTGLGSQLNLPELITLDAGFDLAGNLNQHNIVVQNQGHLDLSALETVIAPVGAELLDWQITSGGRVDLSSLESITPGAGPLDPGEGQTRFGINDATVLLPALMTVDQVTFDVRNGAVVTADTLATYTTVGLRHGTNFFFVDGGSSQLNLPELVTLDAGFDLPGSGNVHRVQAVSQGQINVPVLNSIVGPSVTSADRLDIIANGDGTVIDLTSVQNFLGTIQFLELNNGVILGAPLPVVGPNEVGSSALVGDSPLLLSAEALAKPSSDADSPDIIFVATELLPEYSASLTAMPPQSQQVIRPVASRHISGSSSMEPLEENERSKMLAPSANIDLSWPFLSEDVKGVDSSEKGLLTHSRSWIREFLGNMDELQNQEEELAAIQVVL